MIISGTRLVVADNSGANEVECIRVFGGSRVRFGGVGSKIKVAVKKATPHTKVKKGDVFFAVVVRTKSPLNRQDGSNIRFDENAVVMLNKQGEPVGTRIFGPVARELRQGYMKIVSLAPEVL